MFLSKNANNLSFGSLVAGLVLILVTGCTSMNSVTYSSACTDQKKACGCPGVSMKCCSTNAAGEPCCKPEDCSCDQIKKQITMGPCGSCK